MTWDERGTYRHSPAEQAELDAQRRAQTARWAPQAERGNDGTCAFCQQRMTAAEEAEAVKLGHLWYHGDCFYGKNKPIVCLHERKQIVKSHRDGTEYTCPDCGLDFYVYDRP